MSAENKNIFIEDDSSSIRFTADANSHWIYRITPSGEFEWNPELIKAFVAQVKEEMTKDLETYK